MSCPSCDRDLSYPGKPGHECYEPRRAEPEQVCMIYRRNPRVVATACLDCGLSLIACHATVEFEGRRCCDGCAHE